MFTADMFKWTMNVIRATVVRKMTIHLKKEQRKTLVGALCKRQTSDKISSRTLLTSSRGICETPQLLGQLSGKRGHN